MTSLARSPRDHGQDGVVTREQLRVAGVTQGFVEAQLGARRWRALNDQVICTHNGPLTVDQQRWAAVLSAQPPVALCARAALAIHEVAMSDPAPIEIVVVRGRRVLPVAGVRCRVHESRRFDMPDIERVGDWPVTSLDRSTIDTAVWTRDFRAACRVLIAPVQQQRTTATRLRAELEAAGAVRHRRGLSALLVDVEGGATALSEVAFRRWCDRHGFPRPRMQVRVDIRGRRRYLDAEFDHPDGGVVGVEVDGGVHLTLASRWLDTAKDNDAVLAGRVTLRFPSVALISDDPRAVAQLRAALARHGVRSTAGSGPACF